MSKFPRIHVFNDETLLDHDRQIAAKVHQATVAYTIRQVNKMNPGQQLHAARHHGRDLYWSAEKLDKVLAHINDD
jgi:hypothetical protein